MSQVKESQTPAIPSGNEARSQKIKHGHAQGGHTSRTYGTWRSMHARCYKPKSDSYQFYGARGITVCERWKSFAAFLSDMGEAPEGMTIDRLDSRGDYEPNNCRWANQVEQQNNRTNNRNLTANGTTLTIAEWVRRTGLTRDALRNRLRRGWTDERALTVPLMTKGGVIR